MKSELIKIKNSVEQFKNTKFNCLDQDSKRVYLENTETGALYSVAYEEQDKGFVFDTTSAEVITEPKEKANVNPFLEQAKEFKASIKELFYFEDTKENFQSKIEKASNVIKKIDMNASYCEEASKEEKEPIVLSEFEEKFEKSINSYNESREEFLNSIELFNSKNELNIGKINSKELNKVYVESFIQQMTDLYYSMDAFASYLEHFEQYTSSDESREFVRKSALNIKKRGDVPKICLMLKTEYNEEIDIAAATRELSQYLENEAPNFAFNYSPSPADAPKFLKIMSDKFTPADLMTLSNELNMAMNRMYTDLTPEKLQLLNQLQQRCDYMVQTQKISDHVMSDIISTFNKAFGNDQSSEVAMPPAQIPVPAIANELAIPFGIDIEIPGEKND